MCAPSLFELVFDCLENPVSRMADCANMEMEFPGTRGVDGPDDYTVEAQQQPSVPNSVSSSNGAKPCLVCSEEIAARHYGSFCCK